MRTRHSLGLIGSVALILGVFAPILSLPIVGSANYFSNGSGDGTIVLLVALISLLLTLRRRYEWLLTTGIASLAMLLFTFLNVRMRISAMNAEAESTLAGNPFRGLADVAIQSVQIQWGWIVLVIGSVLLIVAAARRNQPVQNLRKCPFCAELILSEATICKHCRSEVPVDTNAAIEPSAASQPLFPSRIIVTTAVLMMMVPAVAWITPRAYLIVTHCSWRALECVW